MKTDKRWTVLLALTLTLGVGRLGSGQALPPPRGGIAPNLDELAQRMAEDVLGLAEVMLRDLGGTREGVTLLEDTREMAQSVAEFRETARRDRDGFQARRDFTYIDQSWSHLRDQLAHLGSTPEIDRQVRRIDRIELRLREALGLREAPGDLFARPQLPPAEIEAARRDVRMLHDRAEALVASMRASLGDHPNRDHILGDATHLVERSQTFEDFLARNPSPERIETAYASINDVATCLHTDLSQQPPPAPVLQAWQGFSRTQRTVTQRLALPVPPPLELVAFEPLPPQRPAPEVEEARRHVRALHDRAEALVASMRAGLGNYANRDHVFQDASQLVERTDHFEEFLAHNPSPEHLQAAYSSINDVATCLHTDFSQQAPPAPVLRAWQGFSRTQVSVHTALHLPAPPPVVELAAPPSPGLAEARRVSFALRERAETLVATMRTQLGDHPNRDHVVQDVRQLVERTERFEQVLATNPSPDQIRQAYAPISEVSTCLHGDLTRQPAPPPVMQGWNAFTQAQYLIHESLKLPPPPPTASIILMPQDDAQSPLIGMADGLVQQVDAFMASFAATARDVPEGDRFLEDARRLRQASLQFREECHRGFDVGRLAYQFREVDVCWNRLARRINRVAKGRMGPNIRAALQIGESCRDIHQVLAMPGDLPVLQETGFRPDGR